MMYDIKYITEYAVDKRQNIDDIRSSGFSLLELVIVLAIAAILVVTALPGINSIRRGWMIWSGTRLVEISLQWGRMHAIATNTPMRFEVWDDGRKFGWVDQESGAAFEMTERSLGSGVRIVSAPSNPLRFYPRGNAAPAGTYKVGVDTTNSYSVIVAPGGRIRIQKNW
jgi:prepilin-type N-terminal cleavage/methylation domain-containing protein